ncbi:hypothetical protein P154DRAFT_558871 [Amniculicola lignicola CBS 123094]|uniref:Uncharacterized protein n=1 Tax=Amniculicola lignicola CBS 123094 TaxID=1392246 RepID=A0A6A5X2C5_9PLEO|nr:hypothetical protein P154DRAFT_558871 [Amniculicola lignicola CBS 123094]
MKDEQKYDSLRTVEKRHEDDDDESTTELGDGEWEHEEAGIQHGGRRRGFWARVEGLRWMIDTALLLVIFGLLAEKLWEKDDDRRRHRYELTGDLTGFAPTFSQQIVTFKPDPVFAPDNITEFWSNETQNAWLSIVPKGLGYIQIKNPKSYDNLPHPIHDYPSQTVYTTSMTHQLHCLYTMLDAHNKLSTHYESPLLSNPISMPWHINHCYEYLRQAIMCAGDVALEGASTTFPDKEGGEDRGGSDGWDAKHVCKDYSQVINYLEKETINQQKWINSEGKGGR